ncbi:mCG144768, partial [Mus musculus]
DRPVIREENKVQQALERRESGNHVRSQSGVATQTTPTGCWSGEFSNCAKKATL